MALIFKDSSGFVKRTMGAALGAAAAGLIAPFTSGLSLTLLVPTAAFFGATLGGAVQNERPQGLPLKAAIGVAGGALTALGFLTLATQLGLLGTLVGGLLGGAALGALLTSDDTQTSSIIKGTAGGAILGAIGVLATMKIAAFGQSAGAPMWVTAPLAAGFLGLWVSAGAGVRHLKGERDPLLERYDALKDQLSEKVGQNADQGIASYVQTLAKVSEDQAMGPATASEVRNHATELCKALLHTCESWIQLQQGTRGVSLEDVSKRMVELNEQLDSSDDAMTRSHLSRALSALESQHAQVVGLDKGQKRSEAALYAQVALLERLRLCVAQHLASDRERFAVELSEVADQVEHLSDDLDSLSTAIAEADAWSDRRFLADVERAAKRATAREGALALDEVEQSADVDVPVH